MAHPFPPWLSDRAGLFVIGYLAIQLGRTAFAIVAFRGHRLHDHFSNALVWELATGLIWIAGIFADGDARLAIWAVAVPSICSSASASSSSSHSARRC